MMADSPFATDSVLNTYNGTLFDQDLDSFSFLQGHDNTFMEQYLNTNSPIVIASPQVIESSDKETVHQEDITDVTPRPAPEYVYQPYNLQTTPLHHVPHVHPNFYHPYPQPTRMPHRSPPAPMSPPMSSSGSSGSRRRSHGFSVSPQGVNHPLVSPMNVMGNQQIPDMSPTNAWQYAQLPMYQTGTPLTTISNLHPSPPMPPNYGLAPQYYPPPRQTQIRPAKPKRGRARPIKQEPAEEDLISDDEDDDPQTGLGLDATAGSSGPMKQEQCRKARIQSEQRRRDELRAGFERVRAVLPQTNQKNSKVVLLDRAVGHIKDVEAKATYWERMANKKDEEMEKLRRANECLIATVTQTQVAGPHADAPGRL
ncbi:hypothetical protein P7C73_g554, partial [Tremellales sp. Uapishka_1]